MGDLRYGPGASPRPPMPDWEDILKRAEPKILGLDISTTTVGWAIMDGQGFSLEMGYIPLGKLENLYQKALEFKKEVQKLASLHNIQHVFIEEDLQKFRKGFSSARVLRKLSRFNGMASLIVFQELGIEPTLINVNNARKSIGCKIDRKDKSKTTKEKVFDWVVSELDEWDWPTKILRGGPRKGLEVKVVECGDMADAYVMARAGQQLLLEEEDK